MSESGYGRLAYLAYPPTQRPVAERVHLDLALGGVIVIEPDEAPLDDVGRAKLRALELAKVRCVDTVAVIHDTDGQIDPHLVDVVDYAATLGKGITHYIGCSRSDVSTGGQLEPAGGDRHV